MVIFEPIAHTYSVNGKFLPSVSTILAEEGFIDTSFFTQKGRDRGSAVHQRIKDHCLKVECEELPEEMQGYFEAFKKFEKLRDWTPHTVEVPMANNLFAGTPDQIGHLDGKEAVLDIKTGDLSAAVNLQLAAYEILYGKSLQRYALQLFADGKYKLTSYSDRNDKYIFQAAVSIYWYKHNHNIGRRR
jgi:hypothetical protein